MKKTIITVVGKDTVGIIAIYLGYGFAGKAYVDKLRKLR